MAKQTNTLTGKGAMVAAGMETVLAFVAKHTQDECAIEYGFASGGGFWNALDGLKKKEWSANWVEPEKGERKPTARKPKGFLPKRVENWAIGKLGLDVADGDLLPDGFGPDDFLALPDVIEESVNYQRLLSKLCPEKEVPALKAWLGCGLTIAERESEKQEALTKGTNGKIWKSLKTALTHAETLESPEMALAIAALMARFGFQTESE